MDASGNVTADVPFEMDDDEVELTLPFALTAGMTVVFSGAYGDSVLVGDYLSASVGRFRLEATFDASLLPAGAAALPRTLALGLTIGAQAYPGDTALGPAELTVSGDKWKTKKK